MAQRVDTCHPEADKGYRRLITAQDLAKYRLATDNGLFAILPINEARNLAADFPEFDLMDELRGIAGYLRRSRKPKPRADEMLYFVFNCMMKKLRQIYGPKPSAPQAVNEHAHEPSHDQQQTDRINWQKLRHEERQRSAAMLADWQVYEDLCAEALA